MAGASEASELLRQTARPLQKGQPRSSVPRVATGVCHLWSGAFGHLHQTRRLEPAVTSAGVSVPFLAWSHSRAAAGARAAREFDQANRLPEQNGQPRPLRWLGLACHRWSSAAGHRHQTGRVDPKEISDTSIGAFLLRSNSAARRGTSATLRSARMRVSWGHLARARGGWRQAGRLPRSAANPNSARYLRREHASDERPAESAPDHVSLATHLIGMSQAQSRYCRAEGIGTQSLCSHPNREKAPPGGLSLSTWRPSSPSRRCRWGESSSAMRDPAALKAKSAVRLA